MRFTPAFYRVAAICSFASAITTLGLIFLPGMFAPAEDFAARMARVNDPVYRVYAWVYLAHPFLVLAAALGVAMRLRREAAELVIPGLLAFLLWGATEAGQQALTVMAFNPWRLAWLAGDPVVRATMELRTAMYDGVWNAMYFLLLIGFFIANSLYAVALWRVRGLSRCDRLLARSSDPASCADADRRLALEAPQRERCVWDREHRYRSSCTTHTHSPLDDCIASGRLLDGANQRRLQLLHLRRWALGPPRHADFQSRAEIGNINCINWLAAH